MVTARTENQRSRNAVGTERRRSARAAAALPAKRTGPGQRAGINGAVTPEVSQPGGAQHRPAD